MHEIEQSGGKVVDMAGFRADMRFRALNEVEAYWEALRAGRDVPNRSDIDPRGIENALEYAFILEKIAPGLARLRIAGMHLSDVLGMEVRGMPISSFVPPAARNGFAETLEEITTSPAVARLHMSAETGIGKPPLEGRMLLLPLKSDFGDINRILGCFETAGPIGRAPRRFNILSTELRKVEDLRGATPPPTPLPNPRGDATEDAIEPAGMGEAPAPWRPRAIGKTGARRPSYLRLVKSDD